MKISLNWLKEYIDLPYSAEEIAEKLTFSGLEVEGLESVEAVKGGLLGVVVAEVLECEPHPDADKLKLTKVDIGSGEPVQIICGAANVAKGQKVVVATVGATIYPLQGEAITIKKAKIRGQLSEGMICAEDELGLGKSHDGIMVLTTDLPNGSPAAAYFQLTDDQVLEIGLTPNRADAASHYGVARDLKALFKQAIKFPDISGFQVHQHTRPFQVNVENTTACPRYAGLTISGISVAPSPEWLQNRLRSIGLEPINNVVDVTNFVLHELGQPLHAFDADKVEGDTIRVMNLPQDTPFVTLDGKERKLSTSDLMICDAKGTPLCLAGVFGGLHSGVSNATKTIFLESAYFSPDSIRKSSQLHGLKTDASFRFERGTDPNMVIAALKRAAMLIVSVAGGQVSSEVVDVYPQAIHDFKVEVRFKNIDRLIGKQLPKEEIAAILTNLDIRIEQQSSEGFVAIVPPYRVDVTREADIIEELLRIHGINNIAINPHLGAEYLSDFPAKDPEKYRHTISSMLADNGFYEMVNNSLCSPKFSSAVEGFLAEEDVSILNPLSEELGVMRQSLLFTSLDAIAHNINHKQATLKLFEFGKIYRKKASTYQESEQLAVFLTGNKEELNWQSVEQATNFNELYAVVQKILHKLKTEFDRKEVVHDAIFEYALRFTQKGKLLCTAGKLHNKFLKLGGVKQPVFAAVFEWNEVMHVSGAATRYKAVSRFPEVHRDLSLVLDKSVSYDQIVSLAKRNTHQLLQDIRLFDIYEGEKIDTNKKAYAMTFVLQDNEKTLTDKVIDKTMQRLMQVFENELNAVIRK
jgi:phenylalanyl-tRNA synthetase beta chain